MEYFKEYMKGKWKALNDVLCLFEKKKITSLLHQL